MHNNNVNETTERRERKEFKNTYITVPLFDKGRTLSKVYKVDQLIDILSQITYNLITIPLHAYRNEYTNNDECRGNFVCGWIESFDPKTRTFEVCIMERFSDMLEKYDQNLIIYPRIKLIGNNVVGISGLDICEKRYYSAINR